MTVQIELAWLLGTILTINVAVAGFLWRQMQRIEEKQEERAKREEAERKTWQTAWTDLLNRHMEHEEKEFDRLRALQISFVAIQEKAMSYVSQDDLERALKPLREAIEKIERIVDARKLRREDTVSGRAS